MGDTQDSPSSLFGDEAYTTDENVWDPSPRREDFWQEHANARESPSPFPGRYLNRSATRDSTQQQPSFTLPPILGQDSNTLADIPWPTRSRNLDQGFAPSFPNLPQENQVNAESVDIDLSRHSLTPISWNVLSSDSESDTHHMHTSNSGPERNIANRTQYLNTSQQTSGDIVDLTEEIDTPLRVNMPSVGSHQKSNKRRRIESNASTSPTRRTQRPKTLSQNTIPLAVEEVDLREVDDDNGLSKVLEDQRLATIKAQQDQASRPVKLATTSCVICMDQMTDVTATYCGMPISSHRPNIPNFLKPYIP